MRTSTLLVILLICGIIPLALYGCKTTVETNEPGPAGLPKGIVDEGSPSLDDQDFPVYPDSVQRATGVYETGDSFESVIQYYTELLGFSPVEVGGISGEILTFETGEYILMILPLSIGDTIGTEIRFTILEEGS
ncbi:hypothetical protein KAU08_03955 [bacterium]|nr:hypothetical protein [bacterium]